MFASQLPLLPLVLDDVPWGLRQMLVQEGVPHVERDRRGAQGRFLLFDSRNGPLPPPRPGQIAIDIDSLRTPFSSDPFRQWAEPHAERFQWRIGRFTPSEEIARVDKRALRRRLMGRLREEIEGRGGVWIGLSPYPFPYRSAFHLRIDYDQVDAEDFQRLQSALAGWENAVSHFVNGSAYEGHFDLLRRLAGQDVGSHGYRHHTYRTFEENLRNIERGIQVLEEVGLQPQGFTAPHGRFNSGLLKALERLEIGHSSELAMAYDELPLLPPGSNVLQVPVHPVCLGIVLEAAAQHEHREAVEAVREHFLQWIQTRSASGEPVFLYGHPTGRLGRYPELVKDILDEISGRSNIWRVTMSAWAAWWRARRQVRLTVVRDGEDLVVEAVRKPLGGPLAIQYRRGRQASWLRLAGRRLRFSPSALSYERSEPAAFVRPVRTVRVHSIRGRVRKWIDWERETPVDEIAPITWRNVAKRTLRTLWG